MFYQGIVENNNDELKLGRCQVRIFGIHPENKTDYPTSDLPWATLAFPVSSSNISGVSDFMIPQNGSTVWLFFKDVEQQFPVVFATVPKIEKAVDTTKGFTDPDGVYPKTATLDQSGISRLARNEDIANTIIQTKISSVKTNVDCGSTVTFTEPTSQYGTVYPNNRVIETVNHVIEIDDTPTKERIHVYHKSGSSVEYHPNGDVVKRVNNNKYTIVLGNDNILIEGNQNVRIEGAQNIKIVGDQNLVVGGNQIFDVTGNQTFTVGGNLSFEATGTLDLTSTGNMSFTAPRIDFN